MFIESETGSGKTMNLPLMIFLYHYVNDIHNNVFFLYEETNIKK